MGDNETFGVEIEFTKGNVDGIIGDIQARFSSQTPFSKFHDVCSARLKSDAEYRQIQLRDPEKVKTSYTTEVKMFAGS